jgi:hypothetical protein
VNPTTWIPKAKKKSGREAAWGLPPSFKRSNNNINPELQSYRTVFPLLAESKDSLASIYAVSLGGDVRLRNLLFLGEQSLASLRDVLPQDSKLRADFSLFLTRLSYHQSSCAVDFLPLRSRLGLA